MSESVDSNNDEPMENVSDAAPTFLIDQQQPTSSFVKSQSSPKLSTNLQTSTSQSNSARIDSSPKDRRRRSPAPRNSTNYRRSRSRSGSRNRYYKSNDSRHGGGYASHRRYQRDDYQRRDDNREREFNRDQIYGRRRSRSRDRYRKRRRSGSRDQSPVSEFDKLAKKEREKARREGVTSNFTTSDVNSHSGTPLATTDGSPAVAVDPDINRTIEQLVKKRLEEELEARAEQVELEIQKRLSAARSDWETRIRQQVEAELREEMQSCEKREADAKQKCEQLEKQLKFKMDELEESKRKLDEERLEMLEAKRKLEEERSSIRKEKEKQAKEEQKAILGKGRQRLEFSLNKR